MACDKVCNWTGVRGAAGAWSESSQPAQTTEEGFSGEQMFEMTLVVPWMEITGKRQGRSSQRKEQHVQRAGVLSGYTPAFSGCEG